MNAWFDINVSELIGISITSILLYILIVLFIRINGLRSLSKMAAHDFAVTIAIGSLLGSTIVQKEPSLAQGALAIGALLLLQACYSYWRLKRSKPTLENEPYLLMKDGVIDEERLKKARITKADLMSKLREANVLRLKEVRAVVFEATGDISVLHGYSDPDEALMHDVRR